MTGDALIGKNGFDLGIKIYLLLSPEIKGKK